jgi:general stress protein 26
MEEVLHPNLSEEFKKISSFIREINVAMLITLDETGRMHSRPMLTQQVEFDGDLWFFTSESSHKIDEIGWNRQVHLIYEDSKRELYLSVSGTAVTVRDPEKEKVLWRPAYQVWFPRGLSDPDLVLLKIEVDRAEFWEVNHNHLNHMPKQSKIDFNKNPFVGENTEHKKIDLAG